MLTIEVIGAYLGLARTKPSSTPSAATTATSFPLCLGFTAPPSPAKLWKVKERLWQQVLNHALPHTRLSFLDSAPLAVCRGARSTFCRRFRYADASQLQAAYGHDHAAHQTFWGFRLHLHVSWPGFITRFVLAPGNVLELAVAPQLLEGKEGLVLGDRNYWSPHLQEQLRQVAPALKLLAPYKKKALHPTPRRSHHITVATSPAGVIVLAQWSQRLSLQRVYAGDVWHLSNRLLRAVLCHTLCCYLNLRAGNSPLQLEKLAQ